MRVEYGNGGKVHYTRDEFRRVTGIHYDDATTPRFTYDYGANGQVAYVRDNETQSHGLDGIRHERAPDSHAYSGNAPILPPSARRSM